MNQRVLASSSLWPCLSSQIVLEVLQVTRTLSPTKASHSRLEQSRSSFRRYGLTMTSGMFSISQTHDRPCLQQLLFEQSLRFLPLSLYLKLILDHALYTSDNPLLSDCSLMFCFAVHLLLRPQPWPSTRRWSPWTRTVLSWSGRSLRNSSRACRTCRHRAWVLMWGRRGCPLRSLPSRSRKLSCHQTG